MEKSPKERTKIFAEGKLCFECYQLMTENHNAKSCKQRCQDSCFNLTKSTSIRRCLFNQFQNMIEEMA